MLLSELSKNLISTTIEDYDKRADVVTVIDQLVAAYETYYTNLDDLGYIQDKNISKDLDFIINFTLGELLEVAFQSKQERTIILQHDDNIVNLAHEYFGPGDDNLERFLKSNEMSLSELLTVKKGKEIIYFV